MLKQEEQSKHSPCHVLGILCKLFLHTELIIMDAVKDKHTVTQLTQKTTLQAAAIFLEFWLESEWSRAGESS
jgi:hypothetical protein